METNPESVSKTRKQICAALVKAQKGFGPALKSSQNPHFKSRYADLSACVEAVVEALNDNGIALTQHTHHAEGGVCVETILIHESGEELSFGKLFVPCTKQDAQGYGSAITYARRYQLQTALGIAPNLRRPRRNPHRLPWRRTMTAFLSNQPTNNQHTHHYGNPTQNRR
jgi:hypothetical protein